MTMPTGTTDRMPAANAESKAAKRPARLAIRAFPIACVLAVLALAGCEQPTTKEAKPDKPRPVRTRRAMVPQHTSYAYLYPDQAPILNADGLKEFASRFQGRVLLLDFWASWSPQSREELSNLAKLQKELAPSGFQIISCNFDEAEAWSPRVVPILHGSGANYPCVIIAGDARAEIREWLGEQWSYDVPARFILDRRGNVVYSAFSGTPLTMATDQVRTVMTQRIGPSDRSGLSEAGAALRVMLIEVETGQMFTEPEVFSDPASPAKLADEIVESLASHMDAAQNPRIAINPFAATHDRLHATAFGIATAKEIEKALRTRGYYDLIGPSKTRELLDRLDTSALAIEYDPTVIQQRLTADYLIIGWLRGNVDGPVSPDMKFALDRTE